MHYGVFVGRRRLGAIGLIALLVAVLFQEGPQHSSSAQGPVEAPGHPSSPPQFSPHLAPLAANSKFLPTIVRSPVAACAESSFGTMLVDGVPGGYLAPSDVLLYVNAELGVKGMAVGSSPSVEMKEIFGSLDGWTRVFLRSKYDHLVNLHAATQAFGMGDMYECFGYGPESYWQSGDEALQPTVFVPMAHALAEAAGKCLVYGPGVSDLEKLATPPGASDPSDELLAALIGQISPHVDLWVIQLGKVQRWVDYGFDDDGNPYTADDFRAWLTKWVSWIKTAHPGARVWTQLGIGQHDPIQDVCLPPQPPQYLLDYRAIHLDAGVDGIFIMPSQHCMPCPVSPPPGFICSNDPLDHEYYQQSLLAARQAIELACGQ